MTGVTGSSVGGGASESSGPGSGSACPCGGGPYAACCGPVHAGEPAPTAERLMRSRFSAFALRLADFLLDSWAVETRPGAAELDLDDGLEWRRLVVRDTSAGGPSDTTGHVAFTAVARGAEGRVELRERSRFARDGRGRWVYVDGAED